MIASGRFRTKRIYEPADREDGLRVLVDRLWPRGISKDKVDLWLKDVSPSDALRKEVHGDPDGWDRFVMAYAAELAKEPAATAAAQLREFARKGPVTLLFAAKNEERNNAVALKSWLEMRKK
ncbi:DUF488 domain-containing protein [Terrarubrum flagellatum]|uniref:DUF488 domain-containing protein n=1 Tax=Terrirubrum flagellatum TaxID=2895980 RepID=UPI003144D82C